MNEPAFPLITNAYMGPEAKGMTLRDYFAAKAMQGMLASNWNPLSDSPLTRLLSLVREEEAMKDMSEEKEFDVEAFIEYHIGDCSCEHGHECQSCTMKRELKDEIKSLSQRLSKAEAELEHGEKEFIAMTQDRDRLTLRLSHLMDVAGRWRGRWMRLLDGYRDGNQSTTA